MSIAIVTPSFQQGQYIERTVQSVLQQGIANLEYIVMDGGSTDETLNILKKYQKQLRFISEPDRGQAHAINKAIMKTSHSIIGWLNSDDVYYPGTLSKVLDFFSAHPHVDVVYGKAHHVDEKEDFLAPYPTENWCSNRLKEACFISQPAVFFRRRVIERCGLLNEKLHYCLDYEYWLRLSQAGVQFAYLPQVLAGSRLYPGTKTMSAPEKAELEALNMLKDRLGYVPNRWLFISALSQVKHTRTLKKTSLRFIALVSQIYMVNAFRWNGKKMGLKSCLHLPRLLSEKIFSRL